MGIFRAFLKIQMLGCGRSGTLASYSAIVVSHPDWGIPASKGIPPDKGCLCHYLHSPSNAPFIHSLGCLCQCRAWLFPAVAVTAFVAILSAERLLGIEVLLQIEATGGCRGLLCDPGSLSLAGCFAPVQHLSLLSAASQSPPRLVQGTTDLEFTCCAQQLSISSFWWC